jgi:hypothetical protein
MKREGIPDPKKAESNFEKACEADVTEACHRLSNMYLQGFKGAVEVRDSYMSGYKKCMIFTLQLG